MRPSRLLVVPLSLALGLGGTLAAVPASGAAERQVSWGPVENLSRTAPATYGPDVTVDADENALAVWVRGNRARSRVMAAWRRSGSAWSAPRRVPGTRGAVEAEIAFDGDGDLVLVWSAGRRVKAVRRPAGGSWGRSVTLHHTASGTRGTRPASLDLAVNARGHAVVSWETMDDDLDATYARSRVQAAVSGPRGRWSRARTLSSDRRDAFGSEVVVSRIGRVTVVWDEIAGSRGQVMTASRRAGKRWSPSRALSRRLSHPSDPQIAARPSGEVAVAWSAGASGGIKLRRWSPQDGWGRTTTVPDVRMDPWWLDIGMDRTGAVTLAWSNQAQAVWSAQQTSSGGWTRVRIAPRRSVFYGLQLLVNRSGDAVIGWDGRGGRRSGHVAEAAYRPRSSSWEPPVALSSPRGDAGGLALALADNGSATATWLFGPRRGTKSRIQARTNDVL